MVKDNEGVLFGVKHNGKYVMIGTIEQAEQFANEENETQQVECEGNCTVTEYDYTEKNPKKKAIVLGYAFNILGTLCLIAIVLVPINAYIIATVVDMTLIGAILLGAVLCVIIVVMIIASNKEDNE